MLSDKDLADVKKLFSSRKPFNERSWGLILIEEIEQLRRMKAEPIRRIVGVKAPKRVRCTICRLVRKTDCFATVELVGGGMKFAERRSVEIPICEDCARNALRSQTSSVGLLILGDALESSVRTLVRMEGRCVVAQKR